MLYIDKTYFTQKLSVANTEEPTSDASFKLEASIDRYVSQFLKITLGNVLYSELKNNTIDGELSEEAPQKWLNLLNGCNYEKDGVVYTWEGLRYQEGSFKYSLLANFVYVNHFNTSINSQLGQVMIEAKNGVLADSSSHLVEIWNEFVEKYQGNYCSQPKQYYKNNGLFVDYYFQKENGYVSLLEFLKDNKEDYPNVPAQTLEFKNYFGI